MRSKRGIKSSYLFPLLEDCCGFIVGYDWLPIRLYFFTVNDIESIALILRDENVFKVSDSVEKTLVSSCGAGFINSLYQQGRQSLGMIFTKLSSVQSL
jgi:hypothetical protein